MPGGNRGVIAAAIAGLTVCCFGLGLWVAAPSAKPYPECQQGKATNYSTRDHGYDPTYRLPDLAGTPGPVERLIANPEPCHGEDNEKRDLAAQEAAAMWGFWIAALTAVQAVIGVVGIVAVLRSLAHSREANQISRDVANSDLRPWIKITLKHSAAYNDADKLTIYAIATLENIGRLPAQSVRVGTTAAVLPVEYYQKYGPQETFTLPRNQTTKWQSILPGDSVSQLLSFQIDWSDAPIYDRISSAPPYRAMCPYVGVHITYSIGGGGTGETASTFQIGLPDFAAKKGLISIRSDHDREIAMLRFNRGVRSKIV